MGGIIVRPVASDRDRAAFVELPYRLYRTDPHWVPPLRGEARDLISGDPRRNPWFGHARAGFWLAERDGQVVGRISAQVDELVQACTPGLGHWGLFECDDDAAAVALFDAAEAWLRAAGMTRAQGPFSISIWDEPGLLVDGFDGPPTVMMGHHLPAYERLVTARGYTGVRDLHSWEVDITQPFPGIVGRIVAGGERNPRICVRDVDLARFPEEAALILGILNDAWSDNWGFVPLTPAEVAHVGRKLKPIVFADIVRVAEYDGEPVAFMITLPDINELTRDLNGRLFPFGWAKLLWRLRKPRVTRMRVPLMGVVKKLQGSRAASTMAFMMIESIRARSAARYGATRAEIGWILDDNGPMRSIAEAIQAKITRTYRIYEKAL